MRRCRWHIRLLLVMPVGIVCRVTQAVMLRLGLNAGNIYPKLAQHMGAFCARTLYNTSLLALSSTQHRSGKPAGVDLASVHLQCAPAHVLDNALLFTLGCSCKTSLAKHYMRDLAVITFNMLQGAGGTLCQRRDVPHHRGAHLPGALQRS